MRIEPLAHADFGDIPLLVEDDLPLGQIEIERCPRRARLGQQFPAAPEVLERGQNRLVPTVVGSTGIMGRLRALIGDIGAKPHERAGEAP